MSLEKNLSWTRTLGRSLLGVMEPEQKGSQRLPVKFWIYVGVVFVFGTDYVRSYGNREEVRVWGPNFTEISLGHEQGQIWIAVLNPGIDRKHEFVPRNLHCEWESSKIDPELVWWFKGGYSPPFGYALGIPIWVFQLPFLGLAMWTSKKCSRHRDGDT